ncbi:ABC transporter substrate-binding protein [Frankia nepalensis]|uniref:ABC transporter substrate-binding protein n=1 Tax=Frankia nepalensis TaxID=1836974 RepID=UPI0027DB5649|nr:ABC transporter substrate-binding protein [Frankia nepalensis]
MAAVAALAAMSACGGSADGGSSDPGRTVDLTDFTPGPAEGWDAAGFSVDAASLKCSGAAPNPTRGITDTSVKVGGLADLTAVATSSMAGADVGAKVRFSRANDAGGVAGRAIDFIGVKDSALDPARNGQEGQALVEQDQVFAVVPTMTVFANFLDATCPQKVPFFGWGIDTAFCDTATGFGITGCLLADPPKVDATTWGLVATSILGPIAEAKTKSVAVLGLDTDASRAGVNAVVRGIRLAGIPVVYDKSPIPLSGLNDATPIINDLMTANQGRPVDLVIFPGDFASTTKVTEALQAAGYQGDTLNLVGYDPRLAGFPALDGAHTLLQFAQVEADTPALKQLVADFAKYAPEQPLTLPALAGYWSADMFVAALEATGRDLTVDTFLKKLNGGDFSYYVEDTVPETRWPLNHEATPPCFALAQLTAGKYQVDTALTCGSLLPQAAATAKPTG